MCLKQSKSDKYYIQHLLISTLKDNFILINYKPKQLDYIIQIQHPAQERKAIFYYMQLYVY